MKGPDDLALGKNRCSLLGSGSLVNLQRECALLVEAKGIDTVNNYLAGKHTTERPQQVTDDLAGFWQRTYPQVRKELRRRYPKHAWPEDPLA